MVLQGFRFGSRRPVARNEQTFPVAPPGDGELREIVPEAFPPDVVEEPVTALDEGADSGLLAAQIEFSRIESALQELDAGERAERPETSIDLPLSKVLDLLPSGYVAGNPAVAQDRMVAVAVSDLFEQLRRGRVEVPVAALLNGLPSDCATAEAYQDHETTVVLPLSDVVRVTDPARLAERTASATGPSLADRLPDPFSDPRHKAEVSVTATLGLPAGTPDCEAPPRRAPEREATEGQAKHTKPDEARITETTGRQVTGQPAGQAEPPETRRAAAHAQLAPEPRSRLAATAEAAGAVAIGSPAPADASAVSAAGAPPPERMPASVEERELSQWERLHCVDVNSASREALMSLPGVTASVADAIIDFRETQGPFESIFELCNTPRVGRVTFRRMTGMAQSIHNQHRIGRMLRLLGLSIAEANHLPTLAERMASRSGFIGTVISDHDGLLLAESGAADCCEALSAIIPRTFDQLADNMAEMDLKGIRSVSISVADRMFTIVKAHPLYVSVLHSGRKVTKTQLELVERVAEEVSWLLSRRAYAGRPPRTEGNDAATQPAVAA